MSRRFGARRFVPTLDVLQSRIAPSGGWNNPMDPTLPPNPTPPAPTSPMAPVLISNSGSPTASATSPCAY
jgi:hypothetical protein